MSFFKKLRAAFVRPRVVGTGSELTPVSAPAEEPMPETKPVQTTALPVARHERMSMDGFRYLNAHDVYVSYTLDGADKGFDYICILGRTDKVKAYAQDLESQGWQSMYGSEEYTLFNKQYVLPEAIMALPNQHYHCAVAAVADGTDYKPMHAH